MLTVGVLMDDALMDVVLTVGAFTVAALKHITLTVEVLMNQNQSAHQMNIFMVKAYVWYINICICFYVRIFVRMYESNVCAYIYVCVCVYLCMFYIFRNIYIIIYQVLFFLINCCIFYYRKIK